MVPVKIEYCFAESRMKEHYLMVELSHRAVNMFWYCKVRKMIGNVHIIVQDERIKYEFVLRRNLTVIRGTVRLEKRR